jgi:hypothetical protein
MEGKLIKGRQRDKISISVSFILFLMAFMTSKQKILGSKDIDNRDGRLADQVETTLQEYRSTLFIILMEP